MSSLPQSNDLASTWAFLEEGIEVLMTRLTEGMSYDRYMQLYTVAYNYCTSSRMINTGADPLGGIGARSGANLMGADLYKKITDYFIRHLAGVRKGADHLTDEALLKYYVKEWDRYTTGANFVHRLFVYLNRHWVKREKDEGRRSIYAIFTLALVQWRDQMFVHVQKKSLLVNSLLKQIEKQRNGETIDNSLVKKIIDSFVSLGLDENDTVRQNLEVYRTSFETPFILNTELYYKQESNNFVAQNSVTDYMKKVEARLKEEEDRVEMYLHGSTRNKLVGTCERVLVQAHENLLHDEFQKLLDKVASEDLQRMYSILFRVPKGLEPLRNKFKEHVKREGEAAIEKIVGTSDSVDPTAYVKAILEVHSRATSIVDTSFNKEAGFYASLDKACEDFINSNAASRKPGKTALDVSPNLLSLHVNSLLKKSNKDNDEASIEAGINDVMTVFKYVTEKDVFLKFYIKHLSKRLTSFLSASEDAETTMIGKLKEQCGTEYTVKPQAMFTDMNMSKELNQQFKSFLADSVDDKDAALVDAEVLVLGAAHWPMVASKDPYTVPSEVTHTVTRFERFYDKKHSGRKLIWLWQYGTATLQTKYLPQKLIFLTNAYQAAIFLLFNTMESLTVDQIHELTQMPKKTIEDQCGSALKLKILLKEGDTLTLNKGFKSKNMRVKLAVPIKGEQKLESAEVMKSVDEDRKFLIQATIVRIMKSRKTMKHAALMQETVSQVSSRFAPKVPDIKKAIDYLIDQDYIERKDGEKDTYAYIA